VWADNESAQNTASPTAGSQLHVSFRLSNTGDTIQLSAPDGHVIDSVSFGPQVANRSEGRFPESSVTWGGLTLPTPASPNVRTSLALPVFGVDGISVQFSTTPGIEYALQRSDDLVTWFDVAPPQSATGSEMTVTDATAVGLGRFYRVRVSH
jgi:hypothetical protein